MPHPKSPGPELKGDASAAAQPRSGAAQCAANTRSVSAPTTQPDLDEVESELTPGMQVRVVGLRNAREHNGKEGVLISPVVKENTKRWNLRLLTGELLALKPDNLQVCGGGPSMQAMIMALERAGEYDKAAMLRSVIPEC